LGVFVCCNAVLLSLAGNEMSAQDVKNDLNKFPSIPLCGKIRLLVENLKEAVLECASSKSQRLQHSFEPLKKNPSVLDIVHVTNQYLKSAGWSDKLVLCSLKQSFEDEVEFESHSIEDIDKRISKIPLNGNQSVFADDYKPKLRSLLNSMEQRQEKSGKKDMLVFSRKSEKRKALAVLGRILKTWLRARTSQTRFCQGHFYDWREVMIGFIGIAKRRMERKLRKQLSNPTADLKNLKSNDNTRPLSSIRNLFNDFNDVDYLRSRTEHWHNVFFSSYSPVYDGIECQFCGFVYNPVLKSERDSWYSTWGGFSYKLSSVEYNKGKWNTPYAPFDMSYKGQLCQGHQYDVIHQQNVAIWDANSWILAEVAAELEASLYIMKTVIDTSNKYRSQHPQLRYEVLSWYSLIEQEAQMLDFQLESTNMRLYSEGLAWPPSPKFQVLVATLKSSSQGPRNLLSKIQDGEKQLLNADTHDDSEEEDLHDTIDSFEDDFCIPR